MCKDELSRAIERIRRMEECFDALRRALQTERPVIPAEPLRELTEYYDGGQWLRDYELDERGLLPEGLRRGVLSEDGVYDLLDEIRCLGGEGGDQGRS